MCGLCLRLQKCISTATVTQHQLVILYYNQQVWSQLGFTESWCSLSLITVLVVIHPPCIGAFNKAKDEYINAAMMSSQPMLTPRRRRRWCQSWKSSVTLETTSTLLTCWEPAQSEVRGAAQWGIYVGEIFVWIWSGWCSVGTKHLIFAWVWFSYLGPDKADIRMSHRSQDCWLYTQAKCCSWRLQMIDGNQNM